MREKLHNFAPMLLCSNCSRHLCLDLRKEQTTYPFCEHVAPAVYARFHWPTMQLCTLITFTDRRLWKNINLLC